jgi:hypothetical protein
MAFLIQRGYSIPEISMVFDAAFLLYPESLLLMEENSARITITLDFYQACFPVYIDLKVKILKVPKYSLPRDLRPRLNPEALQLMARYCPI